MSAIFSSIWTILVTVFVFGLLIFIHELGHYIAARRAGVGIVEFAIGMGPKIYSWEGKYNTFALRAFPIGGFVSMVGEYDDELAEKDIGKTPLDQVSVWKRIGIVLAGPAMNILLAFLVMLAIVSTGKAVYSTEVGRFAENAASEKAGLQVGDKILEVNGRRTRVYQDIYYGIFSDGIEPITLTVERNGEKLVLSDINFPTQTQQGTSFGKMDFGVKAKKKTVGSVLYETVFQSWATIYMTVDSLVDAVSGRYGMEAVSGPIGIGSEIGEVLHNEEATAREIVVQLASLVMLISVSLGVFNLLPVPVLDGGRFVFYIYEAIRGKPVNKKFETAVTAVFMALLLLLTVLILFKDIVAIF